MKDLYFTLYLDGVLQAHIVFMIFEIGYTRTILYHVLTVAEMVIFKILYMYKYSRIAAMDEYFLSFFMTTFNIIILFGQTTIRICLKEHLRTRFYYQNFAPMTEVYRKIKFP